LGIAHLTALELPPADLVRLSAKAGFGSVGLRVVPVAPGAPAYPTSVGTREHRALRDLLEGEGMRLNDVEFVQLTPAIDIPALAPVLEAGADLGASSLTVSGDDDDADRLAANLTALCDLAAGFGLRVDVEFMRWRAVGRLDQAVALVRAADRPNAAVLVDALHLIRSGGSSDDLAGLPPSLIGAAQLCDASARQPATDQEVIAEAREGRLPPGEGVLPLSELLSVLPGDVPLSVEMPMPQVPAAERLTLAFRSTRRLMDLNT
jgi:sugar phosphate isomerase/epimerase